MYDAIVIGAGPAGATAALNMGRAGLRVLLLYSTKPEWTKEERVQNYWGFSRDVSGAELFSAGIGQARRFGAEIKQEEVVSATRVGTEFIVTTHAHEYRSLAIIIATGVSIKKTGIAGEKEFEGKGVHYCVECDGFFYKNRRVAVIGDGDFAASTAVRLLRWTPRVAIWTNGLQPRFSAMFEKKIKELGIDVRKNRIEGFSGDKFLNSLKIEDGKEAVDGVFIAIGSASSLDFARNLGLEVNNNRIVVDENMQTAIPGVFAAGDCTNKLRQLAIAAGQGAIAALSAISYVRGEDRASD